MFVEIGDGRSAWALRWKDLIVAHVNAASTRTSAEEISRWPSAAEGV